MGNAYRVSRYFYTWEKHVGQGSRCFYSYFSLLKENIKIFPDLWHVTDLYVESK